ncbi:MAG: HAMP domain-containing histidine kinase [Myxococcales bacterium]|jgi:signal transduction histidine kinase|nr:HAMP domain-containing histidine kinase [Myxococcales bacterium]MBL0198147.1 HAMP domain-containing histidine kinase [Myxococcales bacterium]HQY63122.1 HAMP domain-containing sensor histidine kinase [Polyangiaceae bacterium]
METGDRLTLLGEIAGEIAHELRNSLQVITASAYVGQNAPERAPAQLARIARTAADAQRLIDDMLELVRGDRAPREVVDLHVPILAAREHLAPAAATFVDELPADARFSLHPRLFARVLGALFDNAIAVSARPPTIVTRARRDGEALVVEVEDDGPGVNEAIAPRIFDALVTGRAGGTGLGLALARRITAAHGGSLELLTRAPQGALFRVVLPA